MTNQLYKTALVIVTLSLMACSKKSDNLTDSAPPISPLPNVSSPKVDTDLSTKSPKGVLEVKYDRAVLTCKLWAQRTHQLNLELPPNSVATWDLKSEETLPPEFRLNATVENRQINVKITLKYFDVSTRAEIIENSGDRYVLQYSPIVNAEFAFQALTKYGKEYSTEITVGTPQDIHEKLRNQITFGLSQSKPDQEAGKPAYREYGYCTIETDIKPEYQDQFKFEPAKK